MVERIRVYQEMVFFLEELRIDWKHMKLSIYGMCEIMHTLTLLNSAPSSPLHNAFF